jgi:hypothetical protein
MLDSNKTDAAGKGCETESGVDERRSDATSPETLRDIEKNEKVDDKGRNRQDAPRPDFETGEREKRDDAGPM